MRIVRTKGGRSSEKEAEHMTSLVSLAFDRFREAVEEARRLAREGETVNILRSHATGQYILCLPGNMAGKLRNFDVVLRVVSVDATERKGDPLFRESGDRYASGKDGEKRCSP
jgi:hypothetical protein